MAEINFHLRDDHNLLFHLTWIQYDKDEKVIDMLETVMYNNLNFDNDMWEEEDKFSDNDENKAMMRIQLNDTMRLVIGDDLRGGKL